MGILEESVLNLRVLPNDVDVTKMTNDRFIALMDLGRMDIAFRVGLIRIMFRRKWVPVATFDTIRFRHPSKVFEKYKLRTRIIWWDESTFYFEQNFERKGRTVATGYVCATLLGSGGRISPEDVLSEIGQSAEPPKKPEIIARLQAAESAIHEGQKGQGEGGTFMEL